MLGKPLAELLGKSMDELFPSEFAKNMVADDMRIIKKGKVVTIEEEHNGRAYSTIKFPIFIEGKPHYLAGYTTDITERKLTEQDLKRSNIDLERFAYVASHDLQEPLRMMASYAALLEKRYKDKLDSDANDFISYIVDGAKRMRQLIDDLLAFSRAGAVGKPFKNIDMGSVLKIAELNLRLAIRESKAKITWEPLPVIKADQMQMVQIFQNLIDNAIKFRGKEPPIIHISAKQEESDWIFLVKDNGIGIDPKYFDRIFLIFQRLHNHDEYSGTGIGLAIFKRIVESYGGRVWIESELQKGSIFYFTIPKKR
jgi:light-regulated signal transduction histidine kinase (bacteriophytochrome)